ncbi:MAG: RNA methyltransferase [Treponema sp.]|nr:RNA methyltransferase [Treponema sp.]
MRLEDIVIVLARPSEPGNAGAVCRAMNNMGLRRLRTAASALDLSGGNQEKLLARAIHAASLWERAEHFDSLEQALADCTVTTGTTRRRGRRRKANTLTPRELAELLRTKPGRAAIVFGNERTGLDRTELELCSLASHIPVNPEFPSVNVSHAVQIYAYELYQALAEEGKNGTAGNGFGGLAPAPGQWIPMIRPEIDALVDSIGDSLAALGFYKHPGREEQERFLRDLIARAGLSLKEGRYLGNIIAKAGRLGTLKSTAHDLDP